MTAPPSPKSSRDKVRAHRERLKRRGLRPIQIWAPDVSSSEFQAQAHRESMAVAQGVGEADDQDFVEAVADDEA